MRGSATTPTATTFPSCAASSCLPSSPAAPVASIDIYRTVKKLGFVSGKLAYIGPLLTGEGKVKHEGMELWTKAMGGCEKAQRTMKRYNIQDVVLLEDVYLRVRPYIANHPHLGMTGPLQCGACGSQIRSSRVASGAPRPASSIGFTAKPVVHGATVNVWL
jgi:hypothetical protein